MADHRELTLAEFVAEARKRFGDDPMKWAFRCPNCGDVATPADFPHDPHRIGQECAGRHHAGRGCDWAAYGLISGPWFVTMPDGSEVGSFPLADVPPPVTPAQAEAARKLAQETLKSGHLAIERYARMVVPDA